MSLEIDFQHVKFAFPHNLERLTSPHFSDTEARKKLESSFFSKKHIAYGCSNTIDDGVILFANEAFPESAVNDPLGDLRIWNLWQTGIRAFPYPGQYLPLEIFSQGTKVKSTSSMGVLGECLCGLYATSGIGPWPIVRVINRWPDFIFYDRGNSRFALLESKAFADIGGAPGKFEDRFDKTTLQEFLLNALEHLVSDRGVSVWGCFTSVKSVEPFKAQVTMVETSLETDAHSGSSPTIIDMLAEFVLQVTLNRLLPELGKLGKRQAQIMLSPQKENDTKEIHEAKIHAAVEATIAELPMSATKALSQEDKQRLIEGVLDGLKKNQKTIVNLLGDDDVLTSSRSGFSTERYEAIREVGDITLEARRLNQDEALEIDKKWEKNWESVGQPFSFNETDIYRCGGLWIKKKYS